MYNDFPIISERELEKLKNAYNEKLNKIKTLNIEEDFLENFNKIKNYINNTLHYVNNLIKLSKNIDDKNLLKDIQSNLYNVLENLQNIYEINEVENCNNIELENNNSINNNLKNASYNLICCLEIMFVIIDYENNIKVKYALNNIYLSILSLLKKFNSLFQQTNNLHIFSLFKRY